MKTIKQLYRQPMKTLLGILLLTMATAVLCITAGQQQAADTTQAMLDQRFSTVAIPLIEELVTGQAAPDGATISDELLQWMETVAREEPQIVRSLSRHGILSAYIPELTPLNMTTRPYGLSQGTAGNYKFQSSPRTMPYSSAMLVITLDEIQVTPVEKTVMVEGLTQQDFPTLSEYVDWLLDPETEKAYLHQGYAVELTGTVTDVVSLADGYRDPVGRFARLTMYLPTREAVDALKLQTGQTYIVNGMDYVDEYWKLMGQLNYGGRLEHVELEPYDPSLLRMLTQQEIEANIDRADRYKPTYGDRYEYLRYIVAFYNGVHLNQEELNQLNAISMTLGDSGALIEYDLVRDENRHFVEAIAKTTVSYVDENGRTVTVSKEEYAEKYRIPTIAKLDCGVEDFLSSAAGASWQEAYGRAQINNHAFALIGVDKLSHLADFALEKAKIVQGRDFTQEELDSGSRVCIIYEALAQANGLSVGDTVTMQLYRSSAGLPYQSSGALNPSASFYFGDGSFEETASYTIVGICRGASAFADVAQDAYSFTANTIFAPKASVGMEMETGKSILFNTLIVQNGRLEQFQELVLQHGLGGRFKCYDQGYSTIAANFHNYKALARQILIIGVVLYAMMMVLYLLLYPSSMRKSVRTMQSLGVGYGKRVFHVLMSAMSMVAVASLLGFLLGNYLWDYVVEALRASTESAMELHLEQGTLERITLAQMGIALAANTVVAMIMALPKNLSSRR